MEISLQELGSIGEFVAAIATLITLVYLATQIRQNTKVAKAQLSKDLFLTSRSALMDIASNPHLAKLAAENLGRNSVEEAQSAEFLNSFFRLYELYYTLDRQNLLDKNISRSYEKVMRLFTTQQSFLDWWAVSSIAEYQGDFVVHVNAIIRENAVDA